MTSNVNERRPWKIVADRRSRDLKNLQVAGAFCHFALIDIFKIFGDFKTFNGHVICCYAPVFSCRHCDYQQDPRVFQGQGYFGGERTLS